MTTGRTTGIKSEIGKSAPEIMKNISLSYNHERQRTKSGKLSELSGRAHPINQKIESLYTDTI